MKSLHIFNNFCVYLLLLCKCGGIFKKFLLVSFISFWAFCPNDSFARSETSNLKCEGMYGYIYKITNKLNGKVYIGQHKTDKKELDYTYWSGYNKTTARTSIRPIILAIKKYGKRNFKREIVMWVDSLDHANEKEAHFITRLNTLAPNGYNIREGGDNGDPLAGKTKQEKKDINDRISKSVSALWQDPEYRKTQIEKHKGHKASEETKKKMRNANGGENHPMYGKKHSEESRKRQSEAAHNRYKDPNERKKISDTLMGNIPWNKGLKGCYSEETKKKMSEANKRYHKRKKNK